MALCKQRYQVLNILKGTEDSKWLLKEASTGSYRVWGGGGNNRWGMSICGEYKI